MKTFLSKHLLVKNISDNLGISCCWLWEISEIDRVTFNGFPANVLNSLIYVFQFL